MFPHVCLSLVWHLRMFPHFLKLFTGVASTYVPARLSFSGVASTYVPALFKTFYWCGIYACSRTFVLLVWHLSMFPAHFKNFWCGIFICSRTFVFSGVASSYVPAHLSIFLVWHFCMFPHILSWCGIYSFVFGLQQLLYVAWF